RSRDERGVLERAISLVDPELIRLSVVGDIEIDPPVAVEVRRRHAEPRPVGAANQRARRHVLESSVTSVVVQTAWPRAITVRGTVVMLAGNAQTLHVGF